MKTMLIALAASGAGLAATPAMADEISVGFTDLDLSTAKDQRTLEQRIDIAARRVCGFDEHVTGTRVRAPETMRCYAQAKTQGMQSFAAIVSAGRLGG